MKKSNLLEVEPYRDYVVEESYGSSHYDIRVTSGRFASVVYRYDKLTIKSRLWRTPDLQFTYEIVSDMYGEVPRAREEFDLLARSILHREFLS